MFSVCLLLCLLLLPLLPLILSGPKWPAPAFLCSPFDTYRWRPAIHSLTHSYIGDRERPQPEARRPGGRQGARGEHGGDCADVQEQARGVRRVLLYPVPAPARPGSRGGAARGATCESQPCSVCVVCCLLCMCVSVHIIRGSTSTEVVSGFRVDRAKFFGGWSTKKRPSLGERTLFLPKIA